MEKNHFKIANFNYLAVWHIMHVQGGQKLQINKHPTNFYSAHKIRHQITLVWGLKLIKSGPDMLYKTNVTLRVNPL